MPAGRSPEKKRALFARIAAELGGRAEDVRVVLTENASADWSFGNGEALDAGMTLHWDVV